MSPDAGGQRTLAQRTLAHDTAKLLCKNTHSNVDTVRALVTYNFSLPELWGIRVFYTKNNHLLLHDVCRTLFSRLDFV